MKRTEAIKILESVNKTLHPDTEMVFIDEYSTVSEHIIKMIGELECQR